MKLYLISWSSFRGPSYWLAERCHEWGIRVEMPEATLPRLAERCHQVPGMALHVLNKAHKRRSKLLTQAMVEEHTFDFDE